MSMDDVLVLNQAIIETCTNLYAKGSYCVQPVRDFNIYSGKPGRITFAIVFVL
ncbi:hypothetical protein LX32DRAFT_696448 [Colletotrichum zoysiae]|uniref:Uncharacterized protein n=1 Tax=Colletotrichum zoysiae TaxID=1216348 RepID=A0AAD9LWW9_9PEZI|nr:hypothetical protein LX32DRAFT_696448 [Colletotrichum zoysiae]